MATINELERIITYGLLEKDFDILGHKVRFRTLTGQEIYDIFKETSGYDEITKYNGMQIKTLARSIISIDDKKVEYQSSDKGEAINEEKKIMQNEEIVGRWQKGVVDAYYNKYAELRGEQNDFLLKSQASSRKDGVDKSGKLEKPLV